MRELVERKGGSWFSIINQKTREGHTLLYLACRAGKEHEVDLLLQEKCNPKLKSVLSDGKYECCLAVCVRLGYVNLANKLASLVEYGNVSLADFGYDESTKKKMGILLRKKKNDSALCGCF